MSAIAASFVRAQTMADGTLRLIVDVEPCDAVAAFGLFGQPGTAMALAALKPTHQVQEPPKSAGGAGAPKPKGGELSIWVALRCKEPEFQNWIRAAYDRRMGGDGSGWGDVGPGDFKSVDGPIREQHAAHCVKVFCDCDQSRREIDADPRKAELFHSLIRGPYAKHMAARGVAA